MKPPGPALNFKRFSQSLEYFFSHSRSEQFLKENTISGRKHAGGLYFALELSLGAIQCGHFLPFPSSIYPPKSSNRGMTEQSGLG